MPPGPRGLPLLGNVFQLPQFQWLKFTEWKDKYGPVFSLNLAGQPVVVLNTFKVASDFLDKRSTIYSDRPRFIMGGEILTGRIFIAFSHYNDVWRKMRKAAHEGLNIRAAEAYFPLQEREAIVAAQGLLEDASDWDNQMKRCAASTVLTAVYGAKPLKSNDDPLVVRINDLMHRLVRATLPGAFLVDIFPAMLHLPTWLAKWKREGLEWYRKDSNMFLDFYNETKKRLEAGTCEPCFASSLLLNDNKGLDDHKAAWLAGTMFGAGAETTAAALNVFMLAMVLYPNVMKKAQAEIDAVVGDGRMPTFQDRKNLPYLRAMVKEVLRWRPVGPIGLPRRSVEDDWYEGQFIPKETIVLYNVWAMNRDPALFPDYDVFRPERYLDETGTVDVVPADTHGQGHATYGFGRRICIGMSVANNALFIDMASILWALNIEKGRDSGGNLITPDPMDFVDEGLVVRPKPFPCKITPRRENAAEILALRAEQLGL